MITHRDLHILRIACMISREITLIYRQPFYPQKFCILLANVWVIIHLVPLQLSSFGIQYGMEKTIKDIKLARRILFHNESVLLVQDIRPGQGHYFLPGCNVEPGESIKETLPREWRELGWDIKAGAFLGCLENKWEFKRKHDAAIVEMFEVNFL